MADWIETTVGAQATLQRGIDITKSEQRPGTIPVISSGGASSYHDTPAASGPGVVLGRKGVVGSVYYVLSDFWPHDTTLWVKDFHGNDPRFVYYFFQWMARTLAAMDVGSANPTLNRNHVHPIKIRWPTSVDEQKAIATTLGVLDDKIDLNRRMNDTLEAMARAIFKDWFVDFGPTRAKMESRPPYLAGEIWTLFPDRLDNKGKPENWASGRLGDLLAQRVERTQPSADTTALLYVPIDCISSNALALAESKSGAEAQSSLTKFYKHDFLFGAMRPYFHKVCIAPFDGTTRTTAFVLRPQIDHDFSFTCLNLHQSETIDYATRHSTGSTIPYAVWTGSLEQMPMIVPPANVRNAFDEMVRPLLMRLSSTYFENKSLAATRDLLLPRLMSGEIRVRDAEEVLEIVE